MNTRTTAITASIALAISAVVAAQTLSNRSTDRPDPGAAEPAGDQDWYDFRGTDAYASLLARDRADLEQVHRDLVLLRGALEMYADDHDGAAPDDLSQLTPRYLRTLPIDPFAARRALQAEAQIEPPLPAYKTSLRGIGYHYRAGAGRAWIVASVGLPEFPYLAESGNIGLYAPVGVWLSGHQFVPIDR